MEDNKLLDLYIEIDDQDLALLIDSNPFLPAKIKNKIKVNLNLENNIVHLEVNVEDNNSR